MLPPAWPDALHQGSAPHEIAWRPRANEKQHGARLMVLQCCVGHCQVDLLRQLDQLPGARKRLDDPDEMLVEEESPEDPDEEKAAPPLARPPEEAEEEEEEEGETGLGLIDTNPGCSLLSSV